MRLATATALFSSGAIADISQHEPDFDCCFQLSSVGGINAVVKQGHVGDLYLGTSYQDADFCLNRASGLIMNGLQNYCFLRISTQQFVCYTGDNEISHFDISQPDVYDKSYLTYNDGMRRFYACPADSAIDQSYYIYAEGKHDNSGCFEIKLSLQNRTAECFPSSKAILGVSPDVVPTTLWPKPAEPTLPPTSTVKASDFGPNTAFGTPRPSISTIYEGSATSAEISDRSTASTSTSSIESKTPSPTCIVPSSSPSVAPNRVGYPDAKAPGGIRDSLSDVAISDQNSTIFEYVIPPSFLPANASRGGGAPPLCALQFRMPVCMSLPKGYPCYEFSGMEQEVLSNSGMNFAVTLGEGLEGWDNDALHQVFPGESHIIGTFECGKVASSTEERNINWEATSVRDFLLEFLHAGVGDDAEFQDGIGAWVVHCS